MLNRKAMIVLLTVGLIKKTKYKGVNILKTQNFQVEESNQNQIYLITATKDDLKNATVIDTSKFAKKVDLVNLKSNVGKLDTDRLKNVTTNLSNFKSTVNKLDVDKLVPVPVHLCQLSGVVKNDIVKKGVYNPKIKSIEDKLPDVTNLATNTTLNAKIKEVKNEISSFSNLATTTALNTKINEVKNKIPNITNLATTTALTAVENKMPNVNNLVKSTDYNTKISEIENTINTDHDPDEHVTSQEFKVRKFYCKTKRRKLSN